MFTRSYFPDSYFAPGYWPKDGAQPTGSLGVGGQEAGKKKTNLLMQYLLAHEIDKSILDNVPVIEMKVKQEAAKVFLRMEQEHQKKGIETSIYTILLTEL